MGGAHSTYDGQKCIQGFGGETLRDKFHLKDLSVDWKIILKYIFKNLDGSHGLD